MWVAISAGVSNVITVCVVVIRLIRLPTIWKKETDERVKMLESQHEASAAQMERTEAYDQAICRALIALLKNAQTGNATGAMAREEKALTNFIIGGGTK